MHVVVVSDTHLPHRARDLPAELWAAVDAADAVVHAGDWVSVALWRQLRERARLLVAVYGNNDGPELRSVLPEVARAELGGVRFAVVHDSGPAMRRDQRCAARFPDAEVLVFGHSHIPWDSVAANGLRLLNPGSPTDRRRQPYATYLTLTAERGRLGDVVLHRLPRRTAPGRRRAGN